MPEWWDDWFEGGGETTISEFEYPEYAGGGKIPSGEVGDLISTGDWELGDDAILESDMGIDLDFTSYVDELIEDFDAGEKEEWWDEYGGFLEEYDPIREEMAGKVFNLEHENLINQMVAEHENINSNAGSGGFKTNYMHDQDKSILNNTAIIQSRLLQLDHQLDVYNFRKKWQTNLYDSLVNLAHLEAFVNE